MSTIVDTYITYRIITTLTKDWDEQDAYKYGIIDEKGKPIIKSRNLKIFFIFGVALKSSPWNIFQIHRSNCDFCQRK